MEYTQDELDRYLQHINYPRSKHPQDALQRLTELTARQVSRVPFESFSLHYSPHKQLCLDPEALFEKIVVHGKGGYCMELNGLFAGMMRALGYTVLSVGGRVKLPTRWTGLGHMVNIVTLNAVRYVVDVGFGSHQPMRPIQLTPNQIFTQIAPRRGLLEYRTLSQHTDPSQRVWVYSTQEDPSAPWEECNMFIDAEFFRADYEAMNLSPMTSRSSPFVQNVLAMRAILNEDTAEVDGVYTLFGNRVKRHMKNEKAQVVAELTNEEERVKAIEKYFLVRLTGLERRAISGMTSELKEKP
ncbi:hypothetical protein QQS21_006270 [Conoideocrella luteorostrata]|uniref:Arylamine N-acetyltransferase n=1 Tax=Conoideocrella luteorostrata TaxID=1105319 RepID=A0AAJ0CMW6_9HYPO|nr:hypothetical protein QQS21_006270 [Conoideocrella luteorostrata]